MSLSDLMANSLSFASSMITPYSSFHRRSIISSPNCNYRVTSIRCRRETPPSSSSSEQESKPENALLKVAWYGSELLGIAASLLRSQPQTGAPQRQLVPEREEGVETVDRSLLVDTIKEDFQRSYFVTGNLTLDAYEEDCEFADPAGSFKGLGRFKRNCTNFGLLIKKSDMKLMRWEDFEDKGIGHWRFSCIMAFPWRPILSATGYTEYYLDSKSGKVCRHVEHWNVPKMALLKQLLRPSRGFWIGGRKNA